MYPKAVIKLETISGVLGTFIDLIHRHRPITHIPKQDRFVFAVFLQQFMSASLISLVRVHHHCLFECLTHQTANSLRAKSV